MTPAASMPKVRILYVDDDIENLNSFKAVFRRIYDVHLAGSAQEAFDILKETDIQVLITDQRMPGMTGTELLERAAAQYPDILRYMLTGFSDFDPLVDAINKGKLLGYFSKPIDHEFIKSRIEEGLKRHYLELKNQNLQEEIWENERFLNAVIENIPDMIFVKDAENLGYVRFNRAGETLVGYPVEEMIGKTDYDLFSKEDADFYTRKDREVLETKQLIDIPEESIQTRFQGKRWLHTKKIPILDADGNPLYLLGVSRDITEYRAMLENEKKLEAQLRQAQKMEAIGTLAGGIAHDFNNILTAVIGYSDLALGFVEKGSPLEGYIHQVNTAGNRAKELVKQILTVARQSKAERIPVQISLIAKEALNLIRSTLPTTIDIRASLDSHAIIHGDPTHIHQIFMNLCTNAAHAMESNSGILTIGLSDSKVDQDTMEKPADLAPGDYITLTVTDTGKGISEKDIVFIFEPYFTTKDMGTGTGLGLSVVQGIVKSYGGDISVQSEIGHGSTFTIYLPVIKTKNRCEPETFDILPVGNERVLVIDDEPAIATLCGEILSHLGYRVTIRMNSIEALELFKSRPDDFELVITDMSMPNMAGDRLAAEFMKIRPDIPVILCTGYSKNISETLAAEIGIRALLMKPLTKTILANTVRNVLDGASGKILRWDEKIPVC
ncbi:MAG: response regulator [Pseudomonadota bacterium]